MWTVIYIATNKAMAEKYKKTLTDEGMLVQLRPIGSAHLGEHASVEILVPESEAEEAHEILTTLMGS
ncbi:glutamate decarboxylase [Desulfitobacterium sp. Sab5]|uniref:glutamate decarboxylase n=1 Tax=Desulfitobacterium TaxID=36853 RepID=UPI003CF246B4